MTESTRLSILQYAGDFREATERLSAGGPENYRGQKYTVDFVEGLATKLESRYTITIFTNDRYDVGLSSGGRAIGMGNISEKLPQLSVIRTLSSTRPSKIVLRTPMPAVMLWAWMKRIPTLLVIADSFNSNSWKDRLKRRIFTFLSNRSSFSAIANHGNHAARQLVEIGIAPGKVIAWDYPAFSSPDQYPEKLRPCAQPTLIFVGSLTIEKGVGDIIKAVSILLERKINISLLIAGSGHTEIFEKMADDLNISNNVKFLGNVDNNKVIDFMRESDLVLVPSHHKYPEGLPLTIYEAYCSRTPLIVSDHPMFVGNVIDRLSGLIYPEKDAKALADCIAEALLDHALYHRLSLGGQQSWRSLQLKVTWDAVISEWIKGGDGWQSWLKAHSLAN